MIISGINIKEGSVYWIGASNTPRLVRVLRVIHPGDFGGRPVNPMVEFERGNAEFSKPEDNGLQKEDIGIFASLAKSGTKTKLKAYQNYCASEIGSAEKQWASDQIAALSGVLNGLPGPNIPREDSARLTVYVKAASHVDPSLDLWRLIDDLTGGCCNGKETATGIYECTVHGKKVLSDIQNEPNLELVKVLWGHGDKAVDVTEWAHPKTQAPKIREMVAVACRDASGAPAMPVFEVETTDEERRNGRHYEMAEQWAEESRYTGPFVCFDEGEHSKIAQALGQIIESSTSSDLTEDRIAGYYTDKIGDGVVPLEGIPDLLAKLTLGNPSALAELRAKMVEDGDLDDDGVAPQGGAQAPAPRA